MHKMKKPQCNVHKIDMLGSPGGPYCFECDKEFEEQVKAVVWHYEVGQRVERAVDVYDATKGIKQGTIIDRYSREIKYFSGGLALGPYFELYRVKFDDGSIGEAFFWSGLKPIN